MVYPKKTFHLTVTADGVVSLWDDYDRAMRGKDRHETYVQLVLSLSQTQKLKLACKEAKKVKEALTRENRAQPHNPNKGL